MAVSTTSQDLIPALDTNWAERARENTRRANQNDANLKTAVEELQNAAVPVRKIKQGATTYSPDSTGLVSLPSGVVAPATTTAERDAISSPTIGQLIYNTTTARLECYGASGWFGVGSSQIDVFIASGTWTRPQGCKYVVVIVIGGGSSGSARVASGGGAYGGSGGARALQTLLAAALPSTVSVTVGAGGPAASSTTSTTSVNPGSPSSFGSFVTAGGGPGTVDGPGRGVPGSVSIKSGSTNSGTAFGNVSSTQVLDPGQVATAFGASAAGSFQGFSVAASHGEANLGAGPGAGGSAYNSNSSSGGAGTGGTALPNAALTYSNGTGFSASTPLAVTGGGTGTSRSGTGIGGDGGNGAGAGTGNVTATAGAIPGGGGGAAATSSGTAVSGAGGRGEVIVMSIF